MDTSLQNPNLSVNITPNPVQDISKPNTAGINKQKQIRLLILAILLFLTSLVTNYVILKHRVEQQNLAKSLVTKPNAQLQPQQSNVSLKTDYKNPFDKDTQYVNPFSQYKNPFDSLK